MGLSERFGADLRGARQRARRLVIDQGLPEYESHNKPVDGLTTRAEIEIELRRTRVTQMYLRGISLGEIAQEMGIEISSIRQDLALVKDRWIGAAVMDMDLLVHEEIAKLSYLESVYWAAWEKSADPTGAHAKQRKYSVAGDPAFLQGVYMCIDRRIKLLGLDAPIKIDVTEHVRAMAIAAGLDPDEAVMEAEKVISEAREMVGAVRRR